MLGCNTEGEGRAAGMTISDPLLDDATLLISAALMAFGVIAHPKVQPASGQPLDGGKEHDNVAGGGGA